MKTDEKSEKRELVKRIIESDSNNGRKIEKISRSFLGRFLKQDDIDDVMQDSYLKAIQFAELYDEKKSFDIWFFAVAHNSCVDFLRKRKRRNEVNETTLLNTDYSDEGHLSGNGYYAKASIDTLCLDYESDPELMPLNNEAFNLVREVIFQNLILLESSHSSILIKYYYLGQKYNEIAVSEGIPIGTVKSRLNHAKRDLKRLVKNNLSLHRVLEDVIYSLL